MWIATSCFNNQFQDACTNLGCYPLFQELSHDISESCLDYQFDC